MLQTPLSEIVSHQQTENGVILLSIALPHILELDNLPWHHKDPFDRMIISQANVNNLTIITVDFIFQRYGIFVLS